MRNVIGEGAGEEVGPLLWEWPLVERKGAAKRFQTAVALKGKRNSIADPAYKGAKIAFMVP